MAFSILSLIIRSITTLSIMALNTVTLGKMTPSIMTHNGNQRSDTKRNYKNYNDK
jgi:hypothetical protein